MSRFCLRSLLIFSVSALRGSTRKCPLDGLLLRLGATTVFPTLFLEFLGDGGKQEPPESVLMRGLLSIEARNHWFEQNESRSV
jgi:hypothetical protein